MWRLNFVCSKDAQKQLARTSLTRYIFLFTAAQGDDTKVEDMEANDAKE